MIFKIYDTSKYKLFKYHKIMLNIDINVYLLLLYNATRNADSFVPMNEIKINKLF